jgi:hypothetical protein
VDDIVRLVSLSAYLQPGAVTTDLIAESVQRLCATGRMPQRGTGSRGGDEGEEDLVDDFGYDNFWHGLQGDHEFVQERVEGDAADARGEFRGIDLAAVDCALEHLADRI